MWIGRSAMEAWDVFEQGTPGASLQGELPSCSQDAARAAEPAECVGDVRASSRGPDGRVRHVAHSCATTHVENGATCARYRPFSATRISPQTQVLTHLASR